MKKIFLFLMMYLLSIFLLASDFEVIREGNYIRVGKGYAFYNGDMWFAHFKGSPEEIGSQHVILLDQMFDVSDFDDTMQRFDPMLEEKQGFEKLVQSFQNFYFKTKLYPTIKRNIPEQFMREMNSFVTTIEDDSGIGVESIVMSNVFQEMMLVPFCTSMAFYNNSTDNGNMFHARNLDFVGLEDLGLYNFAAVFEPDDGIPFITFIYPSHTGIMHGMNAHGVSVTMNYSITTAQNMSLDGIPFTMLLRAVVQFSENIDQAIELVKSLPRTVGLNITISDANSNRAVVMEIASEKYQIIEKDNFIFTANRYNTEFMSKIQSGAWMHSKEREERLNYLIENNYGNINEYVIAEILRDKVTDNDFIYGINNSGTMASVIFDSTNLIMYASATDKYRTSADKKFNAFSLEKALNGEYAYLSEKSIPETLFGDFEKDWSEIKNFYYREMDIHKNEEMKNKLFDLLRKYPDSETLLIMTGKYYLSINNLEKALENFKKVIELEKIYYNANLEEAYGFIGLIYDTLNEREKAIEYYSILKELVEKGMAHPEEFIDSPMYNISVVGIQTPVIIEDNGYSIRNKYQKSFFEKLFEAPKELKIDTVYKYQQYKGWKINNFYILGTHSTDVNILKSLVGIKDGDTFNPDKVRIAQSQINKSGSFAKSKFVVVPNFENKELDLYLRIEEGFGLYNDPVEFIISKSINAIFGTLTLEYNNLFGKMVNIGGLYNWNAMNIYKKYLKNAYIQFPFLSTINTLKVESFEKEFGAETKHLLFSLNSKQTFYPNLHTEFSFGYEKGNVLKANSYDLDDFDYIFVKSDLDYYIASESNLVPYFNKFTIKNANFFNINKSYDLLWSVQAENRMHISLGKGNIVSFRNKIGLMSDNTPIHHQFILGGSGYFEAYNYNLNGNKFVSSGIEFKRKFANGFELALFADYGHIWNNLSDWSLSEPYASIGGGLRYVTPIGMVLTVQYAINPFNLNQRRLFFPIYQGF